MSSIQGDEDSELVQENNGNDDNIESEESDAESDNGSDWSQRTQEYTFISNKLTEGSYQRIKNNDPDQTCLEIEFDDIRDREDLPELGRLIGENTNLTKLRLLSDCNLDAVSWGDDDILQPNENYDDLCKGISNNRSITTLSLGPCFDNSKAVKILTPLFVNSRLSILNIGLCTNERARQLSSALSRCDNPSLTSVFINGSTDYALTDDVGGDLIDVLSRHPLQKLTLKWTLIDRLSTIALQDMLGDSGCKLKTLTLGSTEVDDTSLSFLAKGLARNNNGLEELNLKELSEHITDSGWHNFFFLLRHGNLTLKKLDLADNNIGNRGAVGLINAFATNNKVENLILNNNDIGDEGCAALGRGFGNNSSPVELDMISNSSITTIGWQSLSSIVRGPHSGLREINLAGNDSFDDDATIAWVKALEESRNTRLRVFWLGGHEHVTSRGWKAITNLVCNKTSVDTVYDSNHTLTNISNWMGVREDMMERDVPEDCYRILRRCMDLSSNFGQSIKESAKRKIIELYFMEGEANMKDLLDLDLNVLPHMIASIGFNKATGRSHYLDMAKGRQSLLYQLFRAWPLLCDIKSNSKSKVLGSKRKMEGG